MAYLDVSPMIHALRTSPEHFEFTNGSLHHIPSRHKFQFDWEGRVRVEARCDCAFLAVNTDQESSLCEAFSEWRTNYWRPIEINREFASHFERPTWFRQQLIDLTAWLHRALLRHGGTSHDRKTYAVPAE